MSDQLGFSFADDSRPNLVEDAPGTWEDPQFTADEYRARLARARALLPTLAEPVRDFFEHALTIGEAELEEQLGHYAPEPDDRFSLWRCHFDVSAQDVTTFARHCAAMAGGAPAGHEYRTGPQRYGEESAGMYVEGIGSLVLRRWAEDNCAADFDLWRSTYFLRSYDDDAPRIRLGEAAWRPAYAAQRIAEGRGIASVPTFVYAGREYTNMGGTYSSSLSECQAWTFVPLADWVGPTYTYQDKNRAYDEGRKERGDCRGLLVLVRGQQCVLESVAVFYDDTPAAERARLLGAEEFDESVDADEDFDGMDEAEVESAEVGTEG
jgi:hypothetical protein